VRNRVLALGSCACLLALFAARVAADTEKHDLTRRDKWQAGDVRTIAGSEKQAQRVEVKTPDGNVVQENEKKSEVTFVAVQKVLEADAEGRIAKSRAHVKEWKHVEGEETDTSLQGAIVEVTGRGKDRTWKVLAPATATTTAAKAWLDGKYGSKGVDDEVLSKAMMPKAPLGVGDTWTGDVGPLADALSANLPVDRTKATVTGTLVGVEGGVAQIRIEAMLPLTGLPMPGGGGSPAPFSEGGVFKIVMEGTHPLTGRVAGTTHQANQTLNGVANTSGVNVSVDIRAEQAETATIGGEVPEPAAAPIK
jgi:hypothetical protein